MLHIFSRSRGGILTLIIGVLFACGNVYANPTNRGMHAYEQALKAIHEGRYYTAVGHLQTSIIHWPPTTDDPAQVKAKYVPYLYLSYCYIYLNKGEAAQVFYTLAQRRGVMYQLDDVTDIINTIESYLTQSKATPIKQKLKLKPKTQPTATGPTTIAGECRVKPADDPYDLPWYFHYALGRELLERGRFYEAARSIERALLKNPKPQPNARTYGMWFLSYRPYFILTRAYLGMNRVDCARESAEKSTYYQEIAPTDPEAALWQEILQKLDNR